MRTDYGFTAPEPNDEVKLWADNHRKPGELLDIDELAKDGSDVPEHVRAYAREYITKREEWEQGAAERPISHHPSMPHFRLFDGPWLGHYNAQHWQIVEADFVPEDEPDTFIRRTAVPSEVYQKLIEADDEEGCRKLAAAVYERIDKVGQLNRDLVSLTAEMELRVPPPEEDSRQTE